MTDDTDDPLDGADVGETRTVRRSTTLHGIDMEPQEFWGSDRLADRRIADAEVVENSEGDPIDVALTWEADLTKTLPPRWDYCRDPRTEEEEAAARRKKWLGRSKKAVGFAVVPLVAWLPAMWFTSQLTQNMTINGQPIGPVGPTEVVISLAILAIAIVVTLFGVYGSLPRRVGVA